MNEMQWRKEKPVVVIPAYRPDGTLLEITDALWLLGCEIVIVDDGSGEAYEEIFEKAGRIATVLCHRENQGKGAAMKTAFAYIQRERKETRIIGVMDADGQHLPEDMMRLLEGAEIHKRALLLGVRKVGEDMPLKSRLGNKITRSVFWRISGIRVSDTQTGLRAFSSELLERFLSVKGERYEYETNVLLEAAREGIPIEEIPVSTIYRDQENSSSHFRAVRDSVRIYKDLLKFSMSSLSSFLLDYLLFFLLTLALPQGKAAALLANMGARGISAFYNYSMNCRFVFHAPRRLSTAADYFLLAVCILLVNNLVLELLLLGFHMQVYGAKLLTEGIMFFLSWLVQTQVIFRKGRGQAIEMEKEV